MTVGIGGGEAKTPPVIAALARSIAEIGPEVLALMVTDKSRQYVGDLRGSLNRVFTRRVDDPDDLTQCFRAGLSLLDELRRRGFEGSDVAVDVTSGTVAMRVGAALAAASRRVGRYRLIGGERERGLVRSGSEKFLDLDPAAIFAEEDLLLARELIRKFRFGAARLVLRRGEKLRSGASKRWGACLDQVALGYQRWDLFDHRGALRTLQQVQRQGDLEEFDLPADKAGLLEALAAEPRSVEGMADLVANAARRLEEGRLDDAVGRLYRAIELASQVALASLGIESDAVPLERIRDPMLRRRLAEGTDPGSAGAGLAKVGLVKGLEVLRDQGHLLGRLLGEDLLTALGSRNRSILAHGVRPVEEADYRRLLDHALGAGRILDPTFDDLVARAQFPWVGSDERVGAGG